MLILKAFLINYNIKLGKYTKVDLAGDGGVHAWVFT